MNKDNKILKFTIFSLFIVIAAVILVTGTYAKYSSSASGSSTATVAKWDIKAGKRGGELLSITGDDATIEFDLFDTILDEDGTDESDVVDSKIAPGTSGKFILQLKNDSQVNAEYTINFTIDESSLPLQFRINEGAWGTTLSGVSASRLNIDDPSTNDIDESVAEVVVESRWPYETLDSNDSPVVGDGIDTNLGLNPKEIEVTASLIVYQVD